MATDLTDATADPPAPVPPRWRRRRWLVAAMSGAVAVVVAAALLAGRSNGPRDRVGVQGTAPGFDLPLVGSDDGKRVRLADFDGRPVVVNFWASWCVPCRREMPALQAVAGRLEGRVAFVGIDHQDGRSAAADFEREVGVRYPSAYDPDGRVAPTYGVAGLPTTVLIDARGRIVARHLGELTEDKLMDLVRQAFGIDAGASR